MCNNRRCRFPVANRVFRLAKVGLAACTLTSTAAAQTSEQYREHVAELEREVETTQAALGRAREIVLADHWDTLQVGFLTVITDPSPLPAVRAGVFNAAATLRALLRADTLLLRTRIYLPDSRTRIWSRWSSRADLEAEGVIASAPLPKEPSAEDVARRVMSAAERALFSQNDSVFQDWASPSIPLTDSVRVGLRWTYVELVVSSSKLAGRCFARDLTACGIGLGLTAHSDSLTSWYDAEERRSLIAQNPPQRSLADWNSCVKLRSDDACIRYLEEVPGNVIRPPLSLSSRIALVQFALELGGDSAYSRLVSRAQMSIADRLSAAAGVSSDSLLAAWHAALIAARPEPTTFTPILGATAIGWVLVLLAVASRSTRWRIS